ncbi:hypothetical protein [Pseudoalteromonas sp. APC 3691]|uniref:hypothetical protein n=1 Tax=Pseudoalteromonas sp. APC 3691 TaxID=3035173 RepID=UPI0025B2962F|nr:hypothetical protein [Pseudoalteromonas sp. APC 3691]MDN3390876.1 hypothetical protein [Pseudoalteromonas sp. APC 3691]
MTHQLQPESNANNILERIFNYISGGLEIELFSKLRLTREIDAIDDLEPKLVLKGLMSYALGDFDLGEEYIRRATYNYGITPFIAINHVNAIKLLGHYKLAESYLNQYIESLSPIMLIEALNEACTYHDFKQINHILSKLEPMETALEQFKVQIEGAKEKAEFISSFSEQNNISECTIYKYFDITIKTLEQCKLVYLGSGINSYESEGLDIYFKVDYSVEDVISLNERLIDNLLESDFYNTCISTRFRPSN